MRLLFALLCAVCGGALASTRSQTTTPSSDPVYQEYSVCSEKCENSFSPHTNPDLPALTACKRGCRLSLIAAVSGRTRASAAESCKEACHSGYSADGMRRYACAVGCSNNVWDRSYQEMLQQEMCSWIMLANYLQYVHQSIVSTLPAHSRLVSLLVASDGHSGVYVSGSIEQIQSLPQKEEPKPEHRKDVHHKVLWHHSLYWLLYFGFSVTFLYVLLDFFVSCFTQPKSDVQAENNVLPEKKKKNMKEIPVGVNAPLIPPGKLVEVIVTEV